MLKRGKKGYMEGAGGSEVTGGKELEGRTLDLNGESEGAGGSEIWKKLNRGRVGTGGKDMEESSWMEGGTCMKEGWGIREGAGGRQLEPRFREGES